jgi:cyclophilin family peptidyl-prolyl cis-trans isomerase
MGSKKILFAVIFGISLFMISCKPKPVEREVAVIETDMGNIVIDLFEEVAPKHVEVFKKLINEKFYDSLYFHRVIPGFIIQGGDPNSRDNDRSNDGMGQPDQPTVPAELSKIGHTRGMVSMAMKDNINSGTSQFFILAGKAEHLDKTFSLFGKVVEGMDVVDKIIKVPADRNDNPNEHVYMKKVTIQKKMILPSVENDKNNIQELKK